VKRALTLALGMALVAAPLASAQTARKREDPISAEQRKLQQTERQLREERKKAAEARARESSVLAELEKIEKRLAAKKRQIAQLDARMKRAAGEVQSLRGEVRQLETQRAGQQAALARRLRAMYKVHVQGGALPLLLAGDDPTTRAAAIRHLGSLASLDARLIQEYRGTSDRLEDRRSREETRQRELASLRADAQREQAEVDADAAKRRVLLAKVRDERAYHERMVGELTEASRRLEAFIRDLQAKQRRLAKIPPPPKKPGTETPAVGFGTLRGRLPWPTEGRVVSAFGAQVHPRFGTRTFRNGVDIEPGEGRDVAAVFAGHVVYTGWFKGYGNLIILDHDNEYYTLYAHVADILVKEGDDVKQGQRIGTVGDTGSLEGTRLYFEVRFEGKPQNPEQWLRKGS
jgi:murein hydrolase activator